MKGTLRIIRLQNVFRANRGVIWEGTFAPGLLTGTGVLIGKTVNITIAAVVWTVSGTARLLVRPFTN